jgi:arginine-tRNA-protein transferase
VDEHVADGRAIDDSFRFHAPPSSCGYLPDRQSAMEYRWFEDLSADDFEYLLSRGWRRFGELVFRPNCPGCRECRGIRLDVATFVPNRSQRRALTRNAAVEVQFVRAEATPEHIRLHNRYHADMHVRRGWREQVIDWTDYEQTFLSGDRPFGFEFRYLRDGQLSGVALCDVTPTALSAVYFYYDPAWREDSPGTFSILQHVEHARITGRQHVYLGFWVPGCRSMAYKANFSPHELLEIMPPDRGQPAWRLVSE